MSIPTMEGITAKTITTNRITTRVLFSGSDDGVPVLFLHGNVSSAYDQGIPTFILSDAFQRDRKTITTALAMTKPD